MTNDWQPSENHPITIEQAKILLAGDLGNVYRDILKKSCAPIFWFDRDNEDEGVLHNGTLTIVETPQLVIGVTAAHVVRTYEHNSREIRVRLQFMNTVVDELEIIAISDRLDLATIAVDADLLGRLGKDIVPLNSWPPQAPREGLGIMLAGYPGIDRLEPKPLEIDFGLFTALGIARRVTDEQITWIPEQDFYVDHPDITQLPEGHDLGGISGGPLIGLFETENHVAHYCLSGVISQVHPKFGNVVAKRADFIQDDGSIWVPR